MSLLKTQAYIDGQWIDGEKTFPVLNPSDETEITRVADVGAKEAEKAILAAHLAFPSWSNTLAEKRKVVLYQLATLLEQHAQDLAQLLTAEQGKPFAESQMEVLLSADTIRWFADEACRIQGATQPDPDESRIAMTIRQPVGVVGVITPWNFPIGIPVQKVFAAIAAGCTVVLKPAEDTPLSALALAFLSQEAGIPPGVLNVVPCHNPKEVGHLLTTHPLVAKITFTGSTEVGKEILKNASSTVKKVTMELGGNCPLIVFEDADLQKAIPESLMLKFFNAGQCCNTINRFLIQASIYDTFIAHFTEAAKSLSIGPLINRQAVKKVESLVQDAAAKGAQVLTTNPGSPIVIKDANCQMRLCKEEIFGPVAAFYRFDTEEEAIAMANNTNYGLAAYFYTNHVTRAFRVARALQAGSIGVNTTNIYSIKLPFGGWKESGIGREGGIAGSLDEYCEVKAVSFAK